MGAAGFTKYWSGFAAAALAFVVYCLTLCPTVYVEGSGELIGAVHFLGTPHPTGYPLFCLLGRLFSALLPFAGVAYKVNLASAFSGALAAGALAALLRSCGCDARVALGAGLAFGFSATFWSQAVIAEVYGLAMLAEVVVMGVGLRAAGKRETRWALLLAFLMGMGLTTHLSQTLIWPGLALLLLWRWRGLWRRGRLLSAMLLAWMGGYSLVLYLPLRNGRGPGFHWGSLESPALLWDHLTGALYRSSFFSMPAAALALNARRLGGQMLEEFTPVLLPLALWGLGVAWRRERSLALVVCAAMLANLAVGLNYHRDPNGMAVFFLPEVLGTAVLMGLGMDDVGRRLGRHLHGPGALGLVGLLVPLVVLGAHWAEADRSGNDIARQYGREILESLPAGAVLMTEGDDSSFILDYLQRVEGMRPDIRLYNRVGRGADLLSPREQLLGPALQARLRREREAALIRRGGRPVYYLFARHLPLEGYGFVPAGLCYGVLPTGDPRAAAMLGRPLDMGTARRREVYRDAWVRKIQANYWYMRGERLRALGRRAEAIAAYQQAAAVAYDSRTMRYNVAVMLLKNNELEQALRQARAAVALDPWQPAARRLLQHLLRRQGGR